MQQCNIGDLSWELLLIDNNSPDATRQVAERYTQSLALRHVFEPVQGLSAARNRALKEFKGDLLVFTDDDVVLDPAWLSAYAAAERSFADAAYFGGRVLPLWDKGKPRWLVDPSLALISGLLVHYDQGEENRWYNENDPLPFGASFALRRMLIERLDPFRLDLGVKGGSAGRGEEAEFLARAQRSGARGAYVGSAVCFHAQDPERFRLNRLYGFGVEKGRAAALMNATADQGSFRQQLQYGTKGLVQLLKGRGDRFRQCVINMGIQHGLALEHRRRQIPR